MSTFKSHDGTTFKSKVEEIVLNADAGLGDVYLVSRDRKYFLAHRIVLVSASTLFATLLTVNCNFCNDVTEEKVVIIFAEISGNILKSFLSLIYTGLSDTLSTTDERRELQYLCRQFQLKSVNPAPPPDAFAIPLMGYKSVEAPECYSSLTSFMHSPAQANNIDKFLNVSMNEFKTEPVEYDEEVENDDYFEDSVVVDIPAKSTRRRTHKCHLCSKDFKFKLSLSNHLKHCKGRSTRSVPKKRRLIHDDDSDDDDEAEANFDPDYEKPLRPKRKNYRLPDVEIPHREEDGRVFCLSGTCPSNNQSFSYMNGLKEHFFEKHATEDQKHFPCDFCGELYGTNALRNRHYKRCCPDNENSNSSSAPRRRRAKDPDNSASEDLKTSVKKEIEDLDLDMPMAEKDGYFYCLSGTCEADERSFHRLAAFKEHFYEEHATDDQKPFLCEVCSSRFGTLGMKNKHMKQDHPDYEVKNTCIQCSEEFETSLDLKNHIKDEHEDDDDSDDKGRARAPFVDIPMKEENGLLYCLSGSCALESRSFQYTSGLKEHFFDKHATDDQKHFPCKKCGKLFGTQSLRNRHLRKAHSIKKRTPAKTPVKTPHTCKVCSEKFDLLRSLKKHYMEEHKDVEPDPELTKPRVIIAGPKVNVPMREVNGRFHCLSGDCEIKNTSFTYYSGLREHYFDKHAREDEKFFPCNICGENFGTNGLRNRHHKNFHPDEPLEKDVFFPYAKPSQDCSICKEVFVSKAKLEEHVKIQHSDEERPFICHECGKRFKHKNNLRDHVALHSDTLITCEVCGQTFKSETFFKRHYKLKHAKDHGCTLCDKRFGMKSQLKSHMRYHTGEKPYVCEACGTGYEMRSALTSHMKRRHSGLRQRKYPCDMCDKLFYEPTNVLKHKRYVHLKQRDFHCEECGNSFRDSSELKNHMEKHDGISFPCPHCTEKFSCRNYLKKHLRKRHRELLPHLANKQPS